MLVEHVSCDVRIDEEALRVVRTYDVEPLVHVRVPVKQLGAIMAVCLCPMRPSIKLPHQCLETRKELAVSHRAPKRTVLDKANVACTAAVAVAKPNTICIHKPHFNREMRTHALVLCMLEIEPCT